MKLNITFSVVAEKRPMGSLDQGHMATYLITHSPTHIHIHTYTHTHTHIHVHLLITCAAVMCTCQIKPLTRKDGVEVTQLPYGTYLESLTHHIGSQVLPNQ